MADITPVTLLIGLAGAGKSTLLRRLLGPPVAAGIADAAGIAVVTAQPDPPMWWNGGCPCCTPRDDVARGLRALLPRARRGDVRRVVIETTGLADPGPILATLLSDTVAASAYRLDVIVAVVDAVAGPDVLATLDNAVRQVVTADRIVLTRTDLGGAADLRTRLTWLNPAAPVIDAAADPVAALSAGPLAPTAEIANLRAWLDPDAFGARREPPKAPGHAGANVHAFCLTFDHPLPWPAVAAWLERLILTHGDALLRMKGILHLQGTPHPVAIHSLCHHLHPPIPLRGWPPDDPRTSRVMFITRGLSRAVVAERVPVPAASDPQR